MATASALRVSVSQRALRLVRPRREERTRIQARAAELPIPIAIVSDIRPVPDSISMTDEWDALGAEALCMLHLSPSEVTAAVDHDLGLSAEWLRAALGRAMDGR